MVGIPTRVSSELTNPVQTNSPIHKFINTTNQKTTYLMVTALFQSLSSPSIPISSLQIPNLQSQTTNPRTIAFTTPQNYAPRLNHLLKLNNWTPLWIPTVVVTPTPQTHSNLIHYLTPSQSITPLSHFSAIAFTSRTGISAFQTALNSISQPPLSPENDNQLIVTALGKDSELLTPDLISKLCSNPNRVKILVPSTATPSGIVEALGDGLGRKVLCPVPIVSGLEEPLVVPDFLRELRRKGWDAVRVDGYETKWAGSKCVEKLIGIEDGIDAMVFTSTAEVEGLLKGLGEIGLRWDDLRKKWPNIVVVAHGPVTASGAEGLGVSVDVVSLRFSSFDGIVEALSHIWST